MDRYAPAPKPTEPLTMLHERLDESTAPAASALLIPSPTLQKQLASGALAVLAAGALSILASVVQIRDGLQPGFTLAHGFEWASLVPLVAVLRTYQALAGETDGTALGRSALGLFGAVVLFQVLDLATLAIPLWARVVAWVAFGFGLLALVTATFAPDANSPAPAPKTGAAADDSADARRARWGGGIILGLLVLLKLAGKGLLVKLHAVRMIVKLGGHWELLAAGLLTLLTAGFTVWFAAAKIRLRHRLGGLAVLLGVAEILLLVGYVGFYAWSFAAFEAAGANRPALQDELVRNVNGAAIARDLIWSSLTALLFWSVGGRYDPDREWSPEGE